MIIVKSVQTIIRPGDQAEVVKNLRNKQEEVIYHRQDELVKN
jgi:hypothetical protein